MSHGPARPDNEPLTQGRRGLPASSGDGRVEHRGIRRHRVEPCDRGDEVRRGGHHGKLRDALGGIHSIVDTGNGILLLVGIKLSHRKPNVEHPFGHGKEVFFWSLIVAVLIFGVGGGISAYEGVLHVMRPSPIENALWSYLTLGLAFLFEGTSFVVAVRQFRRETAGTPFWQALRTSKDPTTYTVMAEDSAALAGLLAAGAGIFASAELGMTRVDGAASIVIGLILAGVALVLIHQARSLLVGAGIQPATAAGIRALALADAGRADGRRAAVDVHRPERGAARARRRVRARRSADEVASSVRKLERAIREKYDKIRRIYIERGPRKRCGKGRTPLNWRHKRVVPIIGPWAIPRTRSPAMRSRATRTGRSPGAPAPQPRYDAVIVGGGGHGLATAYYLAKEHGITNVAVLEKGWLGGGNTGRNTTIVRSNYHLDPNAHFYEFSLKLWERPVAGAQLQRDVQRARRAEPRAFAGRHGRRDAPRQRDAAERHRCEVPVARRDRAAGSRISTARPMRASRSSAACCSRAAARCATTRSPGAMRARPMRCGVDIIQQCEVTGIRIDERRDRRRRDDARLHRDRRSSASPSPDIRADVAAMAGITLPIESHVLQAMVSEPVKPVLDTVVTSGAVHFYISQSDKGELVMGGDLDFCNSYAQRGNLPIDRARRRRMSRAVPELRPAEADAHLGRHHAT